MLPHAQSNQIQAAALPDSRIARPPFFIRLAWLRQVTVGDAIEKLCLSSAPRRAQFTDSQFRLHNCPNNHVHSNILGIISVKERAVDSVLRKGW